VTIASKSKVSIKSCLNFSNSLSFLLSFGEINIGSVGGG